MSSRILIRKYIFQAIITIGCILIIGYSCGTRLRPIDFLDPQDIDAIAYTRDTMARESYDLAVLHFNAGRESFEKGELDVAYKHYSKATALAPDWELPFLQLAILHPLYDNDHEAVRHALTRAVEINPSNPRTQFMLGVMHADAGNLNQAEKAFHEALRLKNDYTEVHLRLANIYRDAGRTREAISEYEWLTQHQPKNAMLHSILAGLYESTGQLTLAEEKYKYLIRVQGDASYAFYKLARFYERNNRPSAAAAADRRAKELKPEKKRKLRPLLPSRR